MPQHKRVKKDGHCEVARRFFINNREDGIIKYEIETQWYKNWRTDKSELAIDGSVSFTDCYGNTVTIASHIHEDTRVHIKDIEFIINKLQEYKSTLEECHAYTESRKPIGDDEEESE